MNLMGFSIPTNTLELFIRSVDISSYIPGRVRLYSKKLINNPGLEREVQEKLTAFAELSEVTTSTTTGSILITYEPAVLRANKELKEVEEYIITHARRRG